MGFIHVELEGLVPGSILDQSTHFLGIPRNFNHPARDEFINAKSVQENRSKPGQTIPCWDWKRQQNW